MPNVSSFNPTLSSQPSGLMSSKDLDQLKQACKTIAFVESETNTILKAIKYAKEDAEINDINYHLTSLVI